MVDKAETLTKPRYLGRWVKLDSKTMRAAGVRRTAEDESRGYQTQAFGLLLTLSQQELNDANIANKVNPINGIIESASVNFATANLVIEDKLEPDKILGVIQVFFASGNWQDFDLSSKFILMNNALLSRMKPAIPHYPEKGELTEDIRNCFPPLVNYKNFTTEDPPKTESLLKALQNK